MCTPGPGGQELRHSGSWWIMAGAFFVASILVQPSFVNCQKSIVAHPSDSGCDRARPVHGRTDSKRTAPVTVKIHLMTRWPRVEHSGNAPQN